MRAAEYPVRQRHQAQWSQSWYAGLYPGPGRAARPTRTTESRRVVRVRHEGNKISHSCSGERPRHPDPGTWLGNRPCDHVLWPGLGGASLACNLPPLIRAKRLVSRPCGRHFGARTCLRVRERVCYAKRWVRERVVCVRERVRARACQCTSVSLAALRRRGKFLIPFLGSGWG